MVRFLVVTTRIGVFSARADVLRKACFLGVGAGAGAGGVVEEGSRPATRRDRRVRGAMVADASSLLSVSMRLFFYICRSY